MNNMDCSRLGKMLHLEIQKGKEAMKTSIFQKYPEGTAECMKRLMMDTKGCGKVTSSYTYFTDRWLSGVKTAEGVMALGVYYCGPEKTSHKGFCLDTLETFMKDWPGGSYILMDSTPRVPGDIPIISIGYK